MPLLCFVHVCSQRVSFYCSQSYSHFHAFPYSVCRLPHLLFFLHCPLPCKKPLQPASSTVGTQFWGAITAHILVKCRIALAPSTWLHERCAIRSAISPGIAALPHRPFVTRPIAFLLAVAGLAFRGCRLEVGLIGRSTTI